MEISAMVHKTNDFTGYMYFVTAIKGTLRPTVKVEHWFWGTLGFLELNKFSSELYVVARNGERHAIFAESEFEAATHYLAERFYGGVS